jgi:RNA polymerase sigma factor (sigma-70 family)
MMTEEQFITAWKAGYDTLTGWLYLRVRREHLAQDLASETYARAWRARTQWEPTRAHTTPDAWIRTIATNILRDHYGAAPTRREIQTPDGIPIDHPDPRGTTDTDLVEDQVDNAALVDVVLDACRSPRHREALIAYYLRGESYPTIGAALGIRPSSVRDLNYHTRRLVREEIPA